MKAEINKTAPQRHLEDQRRLVMVHTVTIRPKRERLRREVIIRWRQAGALVICGAFGCLATTCYSVAAQSAGVKAFWLGVCALLAACASLTSVIIATDLNKDTE